ncbi:MULTISPECIES: GtrA family protein [unclassified Fusibacter]|uniref:GtrA family protein n=1 Tax=unclassified Fusibacter TaxID=2624464 RepID=UPI00101067EA|nr:MULTISPECIES: GtrA family protein [unclassified Fusibacter]MCK8061457.1 GtrA family protein [Fusibacter sp. A2]NPE23644.1 GtrA family protein [Fusibacter sp. A1]RXV58916.1 GtrA family protein [Fusibacter sp. A1]
MKLLVNVMEKIEILKDKLFTRQFVRYLITGFSAFFIEYGLYVLLIKVLNAQYIIASVLVYCVIFWFVFLMNRKWSFESTKDIRKQLVQYGLLFIFNLVVANIVLMTFFTEILGISELISPLLKMACIVMWNFWIYKNVIYK